MTPLAARLIAEIAANGPITVADYMAACLGDPEHGYYRHAEPFGKDGDFITAPEISQMFGELIGAWAVATWQTMGAPSPFILAELGPGRGTLMADLLRVARVRPAFADAARIHLVETSPRLHEIQRATLGAANASWHDTVADLPGGPLILIANEFFDALPVRQYVRTATGWAERMVGLGDDGALAFGLRAAPLSHVRAFAKGPPLPGGERAFPPGELKASLEEKGEGAQSHPERAEPPHPDPLPSGERERHAQARSVVVEVSPASAAIMSGIATRLAKDGGAALVIDYGYAGPAFGDTLQAVRKHRYDDPLAAPGEADITAHVDFTALARAAGEAGAVARPLVTQGAFLNRLGLSARVEALSRGKDRSTAASIAAAAERLAGPRAMGDLFKVLAVASPGLALPAFDEHLP